MSKIVKLIAIPFGYFIKLHLQYNCIPTFLTTKIMTEKMKPNSSCFNNDFLFYCGKYHTDFRHLTYLSVFRIFLLKFV